MRTRHLTQTSVLNLVVQVALLAVLYAVGHEHPLGTTAGVWRDGILAGLVLAQSAIWVFFFYLQDRAEPEPTGYVLLAFLAGMAATSLVALPAEQMFFHLPSWLYRSTGSLVLGATCVRGALVSLLVYAIVRYGFAPAREFDEPADGMAYGAFVGCGVATVTSLSYAAAHDDFTPFAIATSAAMNVLVYGSVGALVGYLVGRTKFRTGPVGAAHAIAIALGAGLIGLHHVIVEYAAVAASNQPLWAGAGAAVAFAAVVLGLATALMYRLTDRTTPALKRAMRPVDPLAVGAGLALLAVGAYTAHDRLRPVVFRDAREAFSLAYDPSGTVVGGVASGATVTQAAFAARGSAGLPLVFTARTDHGALIVVSRDAGTVAVDQLDPRRYLRSGDPLGLTTTDVTVGGKRGLRMRYAYLVKPSGVPRELPRLRWAYTDVVAGATGTYALSFEAAPDAFELDEPVYAALLGTVTWLKN